MAKAKELEAKVKISGKADPSLGKSVKLAKSALNGVKNVGKAVAGATLAAGAAVAAGAVAMVKELADVGTEFQKAQNTIRIGTGATGEALDSLYEDMKNVYKDVPTSLEDASSAIADYNTRLGLSGENLQQLSAQAIQVNRMLGEDISTTVESSSKAFENWNVSADDMSKEMDYIFKVSQSTGTGFNTLFQNMQQYGVQLQEMGYDFDTAAAMMGQLDKAGVNTEQVLVGMKKAVANLAKDGISAQEGMQMYVEQIKAAGDATEATAIASEVFGKASASTMAAAIRDGTFSAEELTASLRESSETIQGAAEDTYTLSDKMQLLKQNAETALEPMASKLIDIANDALPYLQDGLDQIMPALQDCASDLLPIITETAEEMKPILQEVIKTAIPFFRQMSGFLKPIISMLLSAVKQIMPLILNTIKNLIPIIQQIFTSVQPLISVILNAVTSVLPILLDIINKIMPVVGQIVSVVAGALTPVIEKVFTALTPVIEQISELITELMPYIQAAVEGLSPIVEALAEIIGGVLINAFENISPVIDNVTGIIKGLSSFITDVFAGDWESAWNDIVGVFGEVFGGIVNLAKIPINGVVGAINSVIQGINGLGITIPDWVPEFGGQSFAFSIPEIPKLAKGGFTDGVSIAGEAGKEAVISFDPLYRDENLEYWAKAGRMLGATDGELLALLDGAGSHSDKMLEYNLGGIEFKPQITINGNASKQDIIQALEEQEHEFMDMLEEFFLRRRREKYD